MKRLLLLTALVASTAQAQSFPITVGAPMDQTSGASSTNLNAANNRISCAFVPAKDKTINSLQFYTSAGTGTLAAADARADIFADSAGNPTGSSVAGGTTASALTGAGAINITGLSYAVTGGTRYHAVVRNNNATPASNFFNVRYPSSGSNAWQFPYAGIFGGGSHLWGWNNRLSTDGGSTWTNGQNSPSPCVRVCYSDSTCEGYAATTHIHDSGNEIRGTQEAGIKCVVPSGPTDNVIGASFFVNITGTAPAGGARIKYYLGSSTTPTLTKTGVTVPAANIVTGTTNPFFFDAVQGFTPGSTIRITLAAASGGSAGNAFTLSETRNDGTTNSTDTHPWKCVNTTTTDGVNFTDDTSLTAASIIFDPATPFTTSSGTITHPGMQGGFQG